MVIFRNRVHVQKKPKENKTIFTPIHFVQNLKDSQMRVFYRRYIV